jgi:hypothetical protein
MASNKAASFIPSPREQTYDQASERSQDQMNAAINNAIAFPDAQGSIVVVQFTSAGQTKDVSHGLGRAYAGWYPVRAIGTQPVALYESTTQPSPKQFVRLTSDNVLTYYIRFF